MSVSTPAAHLPAAIALMRGRRPLTPATRVTGYLAGLDPAYAPKTRAAFVSDWTCFGRWCAAKARQPFPAAPATLITYLADCSQSHAFATLKRRVATLSHLHDALAVPNPARDPQVRLFLRGLARAKGTRPRHRRSPLRQGEIDRMLAALGPSLRDTRDRALLLTARDTLARRSELAGLTFADLDLPSAPGDGRAVLRRTKDDPAGRAAWLSPETSWALRDWLARAGVTEGAVFRQVGSGGRLGAALRPQGIARRFKRLGAAAGLDPARLGGHSTRLGMCVDLVAGGASLVQVQLAGGWRSPSMVAHYAADLLPELGAVAQYHNGRAPGEARPLQGSLLGETFRRP